MMPSIKVFKPFPTFSYDYKLTRSPELALERLKESTAITGETAFEQTDKIFRGEIKGDEYCLTLSENGKNAFWMMSGKLDSQKGEVKLEITRTFKNVLFLFYLFPIVSLCALFFEGRHAPKMAMIVPVYFYLSIRFLFIESMYRAELEDNIKRLTETLETEWMNEIFDE